MSSQTDTTHRLEVHDTVVVLQEVAVHDTVIMREAVTVQLDAAGDTIYRSVVTDRERVRDRTALAEVREKTELQVDTVFIEKQVIKTEVGSKSPPLCLIVLLIVVLGVCCWVAHSRR